MDSYPASRPFSANTTMALAIGVNDSMLGRQQHESTATSRARHGAPPLSASYKVQKKLYRCKFCPRTFKCWRALGGHQKAHRGLREALHKPSPQAWSPAGNWPSSSSHAASVDRAHFHAQRFIAWRIHYYHPLARSVPPSFTPQTVTGGLAPVQLSSSAPAVDGYRGTGDGGHLVGLHEVNQEESADGIDLTLKL